MYKGQENAITAQKLKEGETCIVQRLRAIHDSDPEKVLMDTDISVESYHRTR